MSVIMYMLLFVIAFMADLILAGLKYGFSYYIVRFLFYWRVIQHDTAPFLAIAGTFVLLESFLIYGIFGLDLIIIVPLVAILHLFKDTFDNHWILQLLLALICYLLHTYGLMLLAKLIL